MSNRNLSVSRLEEEVFNNITNNRKVIFMGTPEFAANILGELTQHENIAAVYTSPDAVAGRGRKVVATPVKEAANEMGLPVRQPQSFDAAAIAELEEFHPDVIIVVAYRLILPDAVLSLPRLGCFNIHVSALPRWRGAAPVERAILAGDAKIGCSFMRMETGLDTGDFVSMGTIEAAGKSAEEILSEMACGSGGKIHALLDDIDNMREAFPWRIQDGSLATYAEKLGKRELYLSPDDSAVDICRKIRASGASHPAKANIAGKGVAVTAAVEADAGNYSFEVPKLAAGETVLANKRLWMGAADGAVELLRINPDSKSEMDAKAFAAGVPGIKGGVAWTAIVEQTTAIPS